MKCRKKFHRNPDVMAAVVAPIVPYAVLGVVIYFFGGKIANLLGAKVAGISTEKFKSDVGTVTGAASTPFKTTASVAKYITGTTGYKGTQAQQTAAFKKELEKKAAVKKVVADYKADVVTVAQEVADQSVAAAKRVKGVAKKIVTKVAPKTVVKIQKQVSGITTGLKTVTTASSDEFIEAAKSFFSGGIWSPTEKPIVGNMTAEQKAAAAAARIKKAKGL